MKKLINRLEVKFLSTVLMVMGALPVMAQCDPNSGQLCNPLRYTNVTDLVVYIVKDILVGLIAPIVITLALLWSGFMFVTAQGNDTKLAQAKTNLLYVLVGGAILLGAYIILEIVTNTVGQITA